MKCHLVVFLKGTKAKREALKRENPDLLNHFQTVWDIRNHHMVKGLPPNYVFYLKCCYQPGCTHPAEKSLHSWFQGGPPLTYLPLPVPDPERPWGNTSCPNCKGFCKGHYHASPLDTDGIRAAIMPPSIILKNFFSELCKANALISDDMITQAAKETLLSVEDVWI